MNQRALLTLIGYILVAIGILSILLMLVGIQFSFLKWIDHFGRGIGFLLRLVLVIVGFVTMYLARTDWRNDPEFPESLKN